MRKSLTILLAASLVTGALLAPAADAAKKKKKKAPKKVTRTVEMTYEGPSGVFVAGSGGAAPAFSVPSLGTEKFISFTVTDDSGQKVGGSIAQNTDGGTTSDDNQANFCGTLPRSPITGGYDVNVYITAGTCGSEIAPSAPTGGKAVIKLTNM